MNGQALGKALKFACLPTISILILLAFGFFSVGNALQFVTSGASLAVALRVLLIVGEFILVLTMYNIYDKEDKMNAALKAAGVENPNINALAFKTGSDGETRFNHLSNKFNYSDKFQTACLDENTYIVKRVPKN